MAVELVVRFVQLVEVPPIGNLASLISCSIVDTLARPCATSAAWLTACTLPLLSAGAMLGRGFSYLSLASLASGAGCRDLLRLLYKRC